MSVIKIDDEAVKVVSVGIQGPPGAGGTNTFDYIDFNTSALPADQIGRVKWNNQDRTLDLGVSNDVTLQIGQEIHIRVRNTSGAMIEDGKCVYLFGVTGHVPTIRLASADNYDQSVKMIAIATEDIDHNDFGFVTAFGMINNVDTDHLATGEDIWLSSVAGELTLTKPSYPVNSVLVGICAYKHHVNGKLFIAPKFFPDKFGDVPGGNFSAFRSNGHLQFVGTAKAWRDELGDAASLRSTGPRVTLNEIEATADFAGNADLNSYLFKNLQLNHDRDLSARIYPHIHFFQAQNTAPNFLLQYRWQVNGQTKATAWENLPCNNLVFTYTSGTLHQIVRPAAGILPPAGSNVSDIVQFRIIRDVANASGAFAGADGYTGAVGVLSFDVHIAMDSVGSDTEYAK